ncbi:hypothetical protein [Halomarina litorea]|uniref:hypothetical protein n=1 Tax=Halomarina litorea TaxID=2961595 RepID=UPI0020C49AA0|nr:hypothetical protein [Halomarina sp. BCD28]
MSTARFDLPLSEHHQRLASRAMQVGIALMLALGVVTLNLSVVVNGGLALAATALPAVLRRDYRLPLNAGLTLWITSALFLHTVGMFGFYDDLWWWDHMTHTLSATIIAATGYVAARAVDVHSEDIHLPRGFLFVYIVLFTLALGVLWEVMEFAVRVGADVLGLDPVLIQYGLSDSLLDLVFDTVGAVVVGLFGAGVFGGLTAALARRLDAARGRQRDSPRSSRTGTDEASSHVPLDAALSRDRSNARRSWLVTAALGAVVAATLVRGDLLWAGFATAATCFVLVPAAVYRTPRVMPPWRLLVLLLVPVVARAVAPEGVVGSLGTYLAVAAVALLVAVEIHRFTTVEMTPWFAVVTVVVTTMAAAGVWAVVRWLADLFLGTQFLLVPGLTEAQIEDDVMWDFVYSTVAGVAAGVVFEYGFRRGEGGEAGLTE